MRREGRSSTGPLREPTRRAAPPAKRLALLLGISFVIPFFILFTLIALDVRLGEGYFAYRYSPIRGVRTPRAFLAIVFGLLACGAVWMLVRNRRAAGLGLFALTLALWGWWIWWGPPYPWTQHMFSFTSPSSDGAFVVESQLKVTSLPMYLRTFPERLKTSIDEMHGTRVLSNPPGMTILADIVGKRMPGREALERRLVERGDADADGVERIAAALRVAMFLCAIWAAAGGFAYALGRLFLSPAAAVVFAVAVTFNPCAVDFAPGKDPAQLVTVTAMMWAWFAAMNKRNHVLAALAGAILVIGATFSLVHIWVALAAFAATLWHDRHGTLKNTIAAAIGTVVVVAAVYVAIAWNIPATVLAVSRRWGEIQHTFAMNRTVWYFIGLPIFLLFLSPAVFALGGLSIRRRRLNLGTKLAICTIVVMLFIYVVLGVTYELPRLWVAFLPPLLLGLCIDRPLLRGNPQTRRPRLAMPLMLIILTQVSFTALHWTLFDVREVEYRLISQRYYH